MPDIGIKRTPKLRKAPQPPLSHPGAPADSDRAKKPALVDPPGANQDLSPGDRVEGLGDFGIPTGEFGTVRQVNEDDALVKWDDDLAVCSSYRPPLWVKFCRGAPLRRPRTSMFYLPRSLPTIQTQSLPSNAKKPREKVHIFYLQVLHGTLQIVFRENRPSDRKSLSCRMGPNAYSTSGAGIKPRATKEG